ncbi:MAG: hypothetical protein Q8L66_12055 [Caulobacter sp.]|nr:hypothetical protein [Caulobacter sp.]
MAIAPAVCCTAANGTLIELEVVSMLSTRLLSRGDEFDIRLAEPLVVDGRTLLPKGAMGKGQVVHTAKSAFGGKPGELILAARFLQFGDTRIPLKALKLGRAGQDNATLAMAASMVTPLAFFISGGEVEIPPGTRAHAKLAADLTLTPLPRDPALVSAPPSPPGSGLVAPISAAVTPTDTPQASGKEPD